MYASCTRTELQQHNLRTKGLGEEGWNQEEFTECKNGAHHLINTILVV